MEQAAEHLAISASQIYSLCAQRLSGFPFHKEGSRSFFLASDLDRWRLGEKTGTPNVSDTRIRRL